MLKFKPFKGLLIEKKALKVITTLIFFGAFFMGPGCVAKDRNKVLMQEYGKGYNDGVAAATEAQDREMVNILQKIADRKANRVFKLPTGSEGWNK